MQFRQLSDFLSAKGEWIGFDYGENAREILVGALHPKARQVDPC